MATLVDTNVLVDLAMISSDWHDWSRRKILDIFRDGPVLINPIIYSEFSVRYDDVDEVDRLLPQDEFRRENLPWPAAFAAAQAFRLYRRAGGGRERILSDFLIGAHAAIRGYRILTRDAGGYRSYFPSVELITPETHP
ncbi:MULTISPECIES: type II toxin-antitoxin system VapC family toxin [Rhizobium]|uniref:type II toxin-antitoxin system VapC family toxin n=1 Tax=Rhizobium TaxID=379 RepID=UPI001B33F8B3|nr:MULTISPECIES: type II toxin-antitoxin system VapC family toxin [Rhizobium]MBX4907781.1 type II toxin-antitoxin system VapC family toxin [Rhizobium bangladeshense]MBX5215547.1 type II toxin-antitoxin system VapC family toxin [Rhizobium sp. NLR9a]MBX5221381.1 type II toxin-antitoxin system VapC family toxin [Rhizobium sp. NLR8a]MBX5226822.1 type II toxin-antitoxin system VapC family toxin [Rhizobium sp. NLR9b]MBX5232711.1 type II toxin-antitoxin system VapC family toxin [Rhizobium sp. NLR4a]